MNAVNTFLENVPIPPVLRVRQRFDRVQLRREELPERVRALLDAGAPAKAVRPGMRIALTAGSRELCNLDVILASAAAWLKERGALPFLIPAMGSHAGADAQGQQALLESYGITASRCGCPIRSSMEVVPVGNTADGQTVFLDRNAAEADGILVINRVKAHTGFRGRYESGLVKMLVIGLGKQAGAQACHRQGFGRMAENLEAFGRVILENAPVLGAVAILENAFDQTARLECLAPEEILSWEPALLEEAKALMPQILLPSCDVLIVDEFGKNYSGTGMDPNVTGRHVTPWCFGGLSCRQLVALRLSPKSHRNGYGIGAADCTTQAVLQALDRESMYLNGLTCGEMGPCRIPCAFETERLAVQAGIHLSGPPGPEGVRIIRIPNTLRLEEIQVSANYAEEIAANPRLEIIGGPSPLRFDPQGTLDDPWSLQGGN